MKFGKRLHRLLLETFPAWRDKFLSYKQLKHHLKLLPLHHPFDPISSSLDFPFDDAFPLQTAFDHSSADRSDFIDLLNAEIDKLNTFFLEKEEEFVIRLQEIRGRLDEIKEMYATAADASASSDVLSEEIMKIRKDIVNVHGEMVLLENYSALNYTGLVKILKKHDKRTGSFLRVPFIQNVLQEPFFSTDVLTKLVRECESNMQFLFPFSYPSVGAAALCEHGTPISDEEYPESICRGTLAALKIMKEFRKGSSTYNPFSVPPFNHSECDDVVCCREVTAKLYCGAEIPVGSDS